MDVSQNFPPRHANLQQSISSICILAMCNRLVPGVLPQSLSVVHPLIDAEAFQLRDGIVDARIDVDDEDEIKNNL